MENHTEEKDLHLHGYESYGGSESNLQYRTSEDQGEGAHDVSQHQFQDINVHHGHGEQWNSMGSTLTDNLDFWIII